MNTVWLRSVMRRYGILGLLFVGAYLTVYTLWKRFGGSWRTGFRRGIAVIGVLVFGLSGVLTLFDRRHPNAESDLIFAIRHARYQEAIQLLKDGADSNESYLDHQQDGCVLVILTPLVLAVAAEQKPLVEALFQHGVHPDAWTEVSALTTASLLDKDDMFRLLIAHGLHIGASGELGRSALINTVWDERGVQGAGRLLDAGADVNQSDSNGVTALMFASMQGDLPLVKLLLARGADPNRKAGQETTALSWARLDNHSEIVTLLKQYGARE